LGFHRNLSSLVQSSFTLGVIIFQSIQISPLGGSKLQKCKVLARHLFLSS
jgi:hypothetical protein